MYPIYNFLEYDVGLPIYFYTISQYLYSKYNNERVGGNSVADLTQERIGEEHPFFDSGQHLFILLYLIVWISDSFWLHYSTFLIGSFHLLLRGSLTLICIIPGVYLVQGAHELIFDETHSNPQFIDWGVYGIVRHPMYLGVLLILLGLFFWTFSLTSMSIWLGFFFFYDQMASYEEEDLLRLFGKAYSEYQIKVGKWVPRRGAQQVEATFPQDLGRSLRMSNQEVLFKIERLKDRVRELQKYELMTTNQYRIQVTLIIEIFEDLVKIVRPRAREIGSEIKEWIRSE